MRLRYIATGLILASIRCHAQEPVAPTPETVGPTKGTNWSDYNIVNSFETGYRFLSVSGNENKYRSDVNFGNGVRLLSSFLSLNSKDGHGTLFDQVVLTTNGLGGDPYESATVRVEKNRVYRYNLYWRKNDYFNPGLTTDGGRGENLLNTSYTMQDHDLTLFPQSKIRFTLGYSHNNQSGAGISSVQLFNNIPDTIGGNIFPVFTSVKILQNEYRLGAELHWLGFTINLLHGWEDFKDDTPSQLSGSTAGDGANPGTSLNSFLRTQAYHGTSPYWQAAIFREGRWISVNGRFTYTGGVRGFLDNETALGRAGFGALANQQILTAGNAQRPVATGNVNVTVTPTEKLTIASRTSIYNVRTEGNSAYVQYDNATQSAAYLYFQYLGIRTVVSDLDLHYQFRSWLDFHGGYTYSDRRIGTSPQFAFAGSTSGVPFIQKSHLNASTFGFRVRPTKALTASFDGEVGRANQPFTPKSDQNYTTFSGRVQYRLKRLQLSALTHTDYNLNSIALSSYSSHARTYSGSVSWNLGSGFGLDATFSKLHLDTLGGIAFFANSQFLPNQLSYYVSNLYTGTFAARFKYRRLDLYAGYSLVQDVGDGRGASTSTIVGPNLPAFQTAQTFPLRFLAPMGRLSFRVTEKIRWNCGYEYFGYHEQFFSGENYLAHTGYTSLLWSF